MQNKAMIARNFSRSAGRYDRHAVMQQDAAASLTGLARVRGISGEVLDIGCGTGNIARYASTFGWKLTQLDLAYAMCRVAAEVAPVIAADAEFLPFADGQFDHAVSSLTWQWLPDPLAAYRETARVLKPGGKLALVSLTDGTLGELAQAFAAVDGNPRVMRFLGPDAVAGMAEEGGFTVSYQVEHKQVEYLPAVRTILAGLRAIGATNAEDARVRGFTPRRVFERVEDIYRTRFGTDRGLPLTWRILTLLLEKKE